VAGESTYTYGSRPGVVAPRWAPVSTLEVLLPGPNGSTNHATRGQWRRDLIAILVMMAFFPAALSMSQTLVPLWMASLRFEKATVGLIQATPALMGVFLGPPLARLATGGYRRETLVGLFVVSAVACWLMSRATTAAALVVPQMMFGLATAAFWSNGLAASFGLGDGSRQDAIQGWVTAAQAIGFCGGPLLGGYLSMRSFPAAFGSGVVCAVIGALAAAAMVRRPAIEPSPGVGRAVAESYQRFWRVVSQRPRVRVGSVFVGLCAFLLFVMGGSFFLVYLEGLGWTSLAAASLIAGREAVGGLVRLGYGPATRRLGPVTLLGGGAILAAVALALTPLATLGWPLVAIALAVGIGLGFMSPAANVLAGASAVPEEQAFGIVTTNVANSGAQLLLAPLLGWWLGRSSYGLVYPAIAVVWIGLVWWAMRWGWRTEPPPRAQRSEPDAGPTG